MFLLLAISAISFLIAFVHTITKPVSVPQWEIELNDFDFHLK